MRGGKAGVFLLSASGLSGGSCWPQLTAPWLGRGAEHPGVPGRRRPWAQRRGPGWRPRGVWHGVRPHAAAVRCPACSAVGDKQPMILKWRILSATNDLDRVSAVALPKLPISLTNTDLKVASDTQFYPGLGRQLRCGLRFRAPVGSQRAGPVGLEGLRLGDGEPCFQFVKSH